MEKLNINDLTEMDLTISTVSMALEKKCPKNWHYEEKTGRPHHGLVYVLGGSAIYRIAEKTFTVQKNDIVFLPEGSVYSTIGSVDDPYHYIVVSFKLDEGSSQLAGVLDHLLQPDNYAYYTNMFYGLTNTWFYKGIIHKVKSKAILNEILYQLLFDSISKNVHTDYLHRVYPAVSHMENNYSTDISMVDLAEMCNLSISHFRKLFKVVYGIPPHDYLNTLRINKAKDLILSELYPISEIAEKVGFTNIYYFSRLFKQITGLSPKKYRRIM